MDRMEHAPVVARTAPGARITDMAGALKDRTGVRRESRSVPARRAPYTMLRRGIGVVGLLLVVAAALLLLSGCGVGASARPVHSSPTPDVSATQTVQAEQRGPVTVQVSAQVRGSIAARTLTLIAQVTVTNHTNQPIHLAGTCPQQPIDLKLTPQGKSAPVTGITNVGLNCILPDVNHVYFDLAPAIAPGDSHTWTLTIALCQFGSCLQQAGTYVLTAVVAGWHQGTIEQVNANAPVLHGSAQGQTVITLV